MNRDRPPSSTVRDRPRRRASPAASTSFGVELRRAEGAGQAAVVGDDQFGGRGRAVARLVRSELARRRIGGEWRDDRRAVPAGADRAAGRLDHHGRRDRLDQDVDRAAAGEADVPGLLVADPVTDDPGIAGRPGVLDLLGRGALDAAAADRAGDPAVGRVQQDGALGSRGGPERPDDHRAADIGARGAVGLPGGECVEQFLHRSGLGAVRSMVSPPTTEGGATTLGTTEPDPDPGSAARSRTSIAPRSEPHDPMAALFRKRTERRPARGRDARAAPRIARAAGVDREGDARAGRHPGPGPGRRCRPGSRRPGPGRAAVGGRRADRPDRGATRSRSAPPPGCGLAYLLEAPQERDPDGFEAFVDPVQMALWMRAFPGGPPYREEGDLVALGLDLARRLGGAVRVGRLRGRDAARTRPATSS